MSKTDDLQWIARATLLNDTKAFDQLTRKYQSSIRRFLMNLTMGDEAWSDDLAQETFIKAWLNLKSFQGISGFSSWLFRIAYHAYIDAQRVRKLYVPIDVISYHEDYSTESDYSHLKSDLAKAMLQLRYEEKTAILLFYMEDKSQQDIAKIMNCPLGTVKTYLMKGKEKMNIYLTKEGYEK